MNREDNVFDMCSRRHVAPLNLLATLDKLPVAEVSDQDIQKLAMMPMFGKQTCCRHSLINKRGMSKVDELPFVERQTVTPEGRFRWELYVLQESSFGDLFMLPVDGLWIPRIFDFEDPDRDLKVILNPHKGFIEYQIFLPPYIDGGRYRIASLGIQSP